MESKKYNEYVKALGKEKYDELMAQLDLGKTFNKADDFNPLSIFLCEKFGLSVSGVYGIITNRAKIEGFSWISYQAISDILGINEKTVKKAADILEAEKLIFDVTEEKTPYLKKKYPEFVRPYYKKIKLYVPNHLRLLEMRLSQ